MMAPAVWGPASVAKAKIMQTTLKRMPILLGSRVRLASELSNMLCDALEAMQYTAEKAYIPTRS